MYQDHPFADLINRVDGSLKEPDNVVRRHLSHVEGVYEDPQAEKDALAAGNPLLYLVYEEKIPPQPGQLQVCMSVLLPGKIGREYYMTKGHYHEIRDTAEVYLGVRGTGYLLMENGQDTRELLLEPDKVVYVSPGWAHRSVNIGDEPLISFCIYPGDAGHNYEPFKPPKAFRKRVVKIDGKPIVIDNV